MKKRRGFTIIELALAIFLFSFGVVSVLQIFPVNRRILAQSTLQSQASFLAQEQIEAIRSEDYADLTVGSYEARHTLPGTIGAFATQFDRETTVSYLNSNYAVIGTDQGLKKVVVTVYWTERTINQTYTLTTFVSNVTED